MGPTGYGLRLLKRERVVSMEPTTSFDEILNSQKLDEYVSFDEREDVIVSLELLRLVAPLLNESPTYWKWMIVGAASAVQGAIVCALADTTGTNVLEKRSAAETLDWLQNHSEQRGAPPDERLAPFDKLLDKCVKDLGLEWPPQRIEDIKRLHGSFRNEFMHFTPKAWSIEKAGLPRILVAALSAVEELMAAPRAALHLEDSRRQRIEDALAETRANLTL